ncbi:MAG: DNA mismatch repair protein MutS, partial [Clostridia bacterium]|nr:DNA mismatch repair protein MutS [Clostridia bacterium]
CFADVSTGEMYITELSGKSAPDKVCDELTRYSPSEILLNRAANDNKVIAKYISERVGAATEVLDESYFDFEKAELCINGQFSQEVLSDTSVLTRHNAACAVGAMLSYIRDTQKGGAERINRLSYYVGEQFMRLDASARRNLELIETMRNKEKRGSLLWVLDQTKTAMGKRLIRKWIEQPLINPAHIQGRLNAVEELCGNSILRADLIEALAGINDIERLMTRVVYGSANARELRALAYTASRLPAIKEALKDVSCAQLRMIYDELDTLDDIRDLIERAIEDEPPTTVREGGMIRDGFDADIDSLRQDRDGGKGFITRLETAEKEKTGIPKLKVGYNRVFGYYIEVTNSYKDMVPEDYIRKQTLANCERYITQELKEIEGRVLGAQDRLDRLEYQVFEKVRNTVAEALVRVQTTAQAIAKTDVLCSFAEVSATRRYTRPLVNTSGRIILTDSRHPVVEALLSVPFVPNDVVLDGGENRVAIITGPNMAGKSTYMRQVALIVLMAQIGCFVPASQAEIGVVDGIYTRVGASDDLSTGQSTFMVEMAEVADILKNATSASLLILDEIGRGTSTFDGMSIARAVLEYAADKRKLGAKTLFATHYHELTVMESTLDCVKNYNIAAKRHGDDITFLRRIVRGGADDSYGIEVAKLAGIPDWVIK